MARPKPNVADAAPSTLSSPRTPVARRPVATLAAAAVLVALVVVVAAPLASASVAVPPATVLSAPYTGATASLSNSWSQSGCGHAMVVQKAFFHPATGGGGFTDRATIGACSGPFGGSGGSSSGFSVLLPLTLTHSAVTVVALTTVHAELRAHLVPGSCVPSAADYSCGSSAEASLYGYVYLYDMTAGDYWFPTHFWSGAYEEAYNYTSCYGGNCSYYTVPGGTMHLDRTMASTIHATGLNLSDQFELIVEFSDYTYAYTSAYGAMLSGSSGGALVEAASGGYGIALDSVTIV